MTETPGWTSPGSPEPTAGGSETGHSAPSAGPATATAPPPAAKGSGTGPIPLRPLGIGELMDGAFALVRQNWRAAFALSLALGVAVELGQAAVDWWIHLHGTVFAAFFTSVYTRPLAALVSILAAGLLTPVVGNAMLGRETSPREAWTQLRPQLGRVIGLYLLIVVILLAALGVPVGLLSLLAAASGQAAWLVLLPFAVLPAVWLSISLLLALPALVLEKQTVPGALKRSWRLVRGSWWRIFGLLLVFSVVLFLVTQILGTPTRLLAQLLGGAIGDPGTDDTGAAISIAVSGIGGVLAHTVTIPLAGALYALVYTDQRIRREALDLELSRAAGLPGYSWNDRPTAPVPGQHTPSGA
ncbi:glycerophosphoryl diester phosphodiesterase membrane domain-containing protein [Streptomyces sp. TLI_171]|uniref:glycerophosphoryl diester phosphodiesterase membrane domain-containing protein n=1 Tax=Streptomyces sp. TLI_171 TaxID=1938859 RepID=UPI000C181A1F|nr:glycerophosphoryl diester phosphodiesterase membrane domain-containing protein [Streptomyces sp. TLI_171]RKE19329.1 glycerophosphoryl diester phosphodiesterase family protein [Streptomyces sp. TLI_171]